jgi:hypothetical protein
MRRSPRRICEKILDRAAAGLFGMFEFVFVPCTHDREVFREERYRNVTRRRVP